MLQSINEIVYVEFCCLSLLIKVLKIGMTLRSELKVIYDIIQNDIEG